MSKRYITLADGRRIGLGRYVEAWRQCLALDPRTWIGRGVDGWGQPAGEALVDLRRGMDDRINRHLPWYGRGRKWDYQWQIETWRAARDLNTRHLVIRWLPPWLKERFSHRLENKC